MKRFLFPFLLGVIILTVLGLVWYANAYLPTERLYQSYEELEPTESRHFAVRFINSLGDAAFYQYDSITSVEKVFPGLPPHSDKWFIFHVSADRYKNSPITRFINPWGSESISEYAIDQFCFNQKFTKCAQAKYAISYRETKAWLYDTLQDSFVPNGLDTVSNYLNRNRYTIFEKLKDEYFFYHHTLQQEDSIRVFFSENPKKPWPARILLVEGKNIRLKASDSGISITTEKGFIEVHPALQALLDSLEIDYSK